MLLSTFLASLAGTLGLAIASSLAIYESLDVYYEKPIEQAKELLDLPIYKPDRKNMILTHGFKGTQDGPCMLEILGRAIECNYLNVFFFIWEKEAAALELLDIFPSLGDPTSYLTKGLLNCVLQANLLCIALSDMADTGKFSLNNTTAVGHSLGGHLLGLVGRCLKNLKKTLKRISGCDVPRQGFDPAIIPPLNKDCAEIVDIIITDPTLAVDKPNGTANFWVNLGRFQPTISKEKQMQPGCPQRGTISFSANSLCSHNFCIKLWAQSFKTALVADNSDDYSKSILGIIFGSSPMGAKLDENAQGNYYMNTSCCPPYQPVNEETTANCSEISKISLTSYCQNVCG